MAEAISNFIKEINSAIGPIIEIQCSTDRNYPHFELVLAENDYVMCDQVVLNSDGKFRKLITEQGLKHFGIDAGFNNTGRVFWFIEK